MESFAIKTEGWYKKKHPVTAPHFEVVAKQPSNIAKVFSYIYYAVGRSVCLTGNVEVLCGSNCTQIIKYLPSVPEIRGFELYSGSADRNKIMWQHC